MKATKAEVQQRVEQVLKLRLLGAEFHDMREYARENDPDTGRPWNVSDGQLWRYVAKSDALLAKHLETDRPKLFNRHLAQRRALYARTMEAADWRAALAVLKDEAELQGLYPVKQIGIQAEPVTLQVVEELIDVKQMTDEELGAVIARGERERTMNEAELRQEEYREEAERLALLPVADQQEIIGMYRACADNPKVPAKERERGQERVEALERHLKRLNRAKKSDAK